MEDTPNAAERALDKPSEVSPPKQIDHALCARMVIREGKTFQESAIAAGYAPSVAARGLKLSMAESSSLTEAIRQEEKRIDVNINRLKPLAINRLYHEILNVQSSNGMKAIELAGRFKETDWYVRSTETNLGILINMHDTPPVPDNPVIDVSQE